MRTLADNFICNTQAAFFQMLLLKVQLSACSCNRTLLVENGRLASFSSLSIALYYKIIHHNLPTRVGRENSSTCSKETYLRGAGQKVGSIDYCVCLFMALLSVFSSWESIMLTYFLIRRWLASHSMTTRRTQTRQRRGIIFRSQHIPKNYIRIIPSKITNQGKREKILPGPNIFLKITYTLYPQK